jgi:Chaperone of endosialidase
MNPLTQSKNTTILPVLIALTLGCFGLSPQARAVCQEGCDLVNDNTFLGDDALLNNSTGPANTAVGSQALLTNVTDGSNTAVGSNALTFSEDFDFNTAVGASALEFNNADFNTAVGAGAMLFNDTGSNNTAMGFFAAQINIDGSNNAAFGFEALRRNRHGNGNTAVGNLALSFCTGHNNTAIGESAGSNIDAGSNNILLGSKGRREDNNTIRIGSERQTQTFISGISGTTVAGGVGVFIDSTGKLGTLTSSARYKKNIQPMNRASEKILSLHPVTFEYKEELDPQAIPQFGLVAEDVAKVDPNLVARDDEGKPYTVRYEAVNAMLLNEFLKEHRKVEEQARINQKQEATIAGLKSALEKQAAQLQEVSKRLEAASLPPRLVENR